MDMDEFYSYHVQQKLAFCLSFLLNIEQLSRPLDFNAQTKWSDLFSQTIGA